MLDPAKPDWAAGIPSDTMIVIGTNCTYQAVINTMRALSDRTVRYVPSIPFVK
ncbi:MAG: hypothetical protein OQJ84_10775 [Xanthomonadales bacterium]|nr:hypothetical protein [Xanthomonadales bacterium]